MSLQVCIFRKLDVPELWDTLYLCALHCALDNEGRYAHQPELQRKRRRSPPPEAGEVQDGVAHVFAWLQRKPDIAKAVLTAQRARESSTPLTLGYLFKTLPDMLFEAAARGFFGATATEWQLDATDAQACTRMMQLLPRQASITAVRLKGHGMHT